MPKTALSKVSITRALRDVVKQDMASLLSFVERLEKAVVTESTTPRTIAAGDITEREVFELFKLSNTYSEFGRLRTYDIPEIEAKASLTSLTLPSASKELLGDISETWPLCNESNIRVFISMLIHFSIDRINTESRTGRLLDEPDLSPDLLPPQRPSSPHTPKREIPSTILNNLVTLKAYTGVLVSSETTNSNGQRVVVHGFIDYGVSYAESAPDSLGTFLAVMAKAIGKLDDQAWAQLLCYMAIIQKHRKMEGKTSTTVYGCLTDGKTYRFARISYQGKSNHQQVSRSKLFDIVTEMDEVYHFFTQCLRAILRSSPTTSPSKPSDISAEVTQFEQNVQPKYIFEFEEVDVPEEELMDL